MNKIILMILLASAFSCQSPQEQSRYLNLLDLGTNSLTTSTPVDLNKPRLVELPKAVVFLKYMIKPDQFISCNGVLIAPFKILTAGHCFFDVLNLPNPDQQPNKKNLTIQYGDVIADSATMQSLSSQHIISIEVHKNFFKDQRNKDRSFGKAYENSIYSRSDVALITLDQMQMINTPHFDHFKTLPDFYSVDDGTFDKSNPNNFSYALFLAYTTFTDFNVVNTANAHLRFAIGKPNLEISTVEPGIILSTLEQLKFENSVIGLCKGDSGSPLFYKINGTKNQHILVGIAVNIIKHEVNSNCSDTVVFSLIKNHREWLNY